ncbi:MAG: hypothetical protein KC657_18800 [Myxococcales bacterium]|nr:hypothetical protein [Myxococcales bacterium]
MLTVHEITRDDGSLSPVGLRVEGEALCIVEEDDGLPLPDGALESVMKRFGGPIDDRARLHEVDALALPGGAALKRMRHKGFYDVIAKDYLVLEVDGQEPLCALATTVAGALSHVAHAYRRATV